MVASRPNSVGAKWQALLWRDGEEGTGSRFCLCTCSLCDLGQATALRTLCYLGFPRLQVQVLYFGRDSRKRCEGGTLVREEGSKGQCCEQVATRAQSHLGPGKGRVGHPTGGKEALDSLSLPLVMEGCSPCTNAQPSVLPAWPSLLSRVEDTSHGRERHRELSLMGR